MLPETVNQILTGVGVTIAAIIAALFGWKSKPPSTSGSESSEHAELARLRLERQEERERTISLEIKALRADFELVIKAMKESSADQFQELEEAAHRVDERLRMIERKVDVIEDRQARQR